MTRLGLLLCGLAACTAGPSGGALSVLYDGCDNIGQRCTLPAEGGTLRLWVEAEESLQIRVDGREVQAPTSLIEGGQQLSIELVGGAQRLELIGESSEAHFELALGLSPTLPGRDEVDCASAPPAEPGAAAMTEVHCAWAALRQADSDEARSTASEALPARLREGADGLDGAGLHTEAARVRSAAIFMATRGDAHDLAWDIVQDLPREGTGEGRWIAANMEALVAKEAGDYERADRALARAERLIRLLDMPRRRVESTAGLRAATAAGLGDLDGALATWQRIADLHPPTDDCDRRRAVALENTAWYELLRRRAGAAASAGIDPRARLLAAREAYEACEDSAHDQASIQANLAFEAWSREAWQEALTASEGVGDAARPKDRAWASTVRAESLARLGRAREALDEARHAVRIASRSRVPDALPFAHLVAAEAALELGQRDTTREHLAAARSALFERLPDLPSHTDPASFFGMHLRATPGVVALSVRLALQDGEPSEALTVLRQLRGAATRALRRQVDLQSLDPSTRERWKQARADHERLRQDLAAEVAGNWSLSGEDLERARRDQAQQQQVVDRALSHALDLLPARSPTDADLRAPQQGERLVAALPIDGRWLVFIASDQATRVLDGPPADVDERGLTDALVRLLLPELEGVRRVSILPWGQVHELDLHVHPVDGVRLVDRVDVAWSLDLPPRPQSPAEGPLLVIADPDGSLPSARTEVRALAALPQARVLRGEQATHEASLAALDGAAAWHFAGHGRLDPERGWRSGLQLADARLEVADLLGLAEPPALAVLSGCETGRAPRRHGVATLGIAQALLVAGSGTVVASSRPVQDNAASRQVATLLENARTPQDLVRDLNALQRAHTEDVHVGSWRAWTR